MELLYFLLPAIIVFGVATSYEDFRFSRIRNSQVLAAIIYSVAVTSGAVAFLYFTKELVSFAYVLDFSLNVVLSLLAGFIIWKMGFWGAGDAKLFLAYSALVPLSVYFYGYVNFFPSLIILVNTFIPMFVFLLVKLMAGSSRKLKMEIVKRLSLRGLVMPTISLIGLSWIVRMLMVFVGVRLDLFAYLVLLPIVYMVLERAFSYGAKYFYAGLLVLSVVFDYGYILSLNFLYYMLFLIGFYVIIRYFIFELSQEFFSTGVEIDSLKPGHMPAEVIFRDRGKYRKAGMSEFSSMKGVKTVFGTKKLTSEDVETLRKLRRQGKIGGLLKVHQTIPFAPFMFLGVLLTIALQGNIFTAIIAMIS